MPESNCNSRGAITKEIVSSAACRTIDRGIQCESRKNKPAPLSESTGAPLCPNRSCNSAGPPFTLSGAMARLLSVGPGCSYVSSATVTHIAKQSGGLVPPFSLPIAFSFCSSPARRQVRPGGPLLFSNIRFRFRFRFRFRSRFSLRLNGFRFPVPVASCSGLVYKFA
jgi:hypothetical protein